jgi:hypothetical protein
MIGRKAGIVEQIYIKISRWKSTILCNTKVSRSFSMGSGSTEGFRRLKAILDRFDNSNPTFIRNYVTPVCVCLPFCSQCGTCTGEARWPSKRQAPVYFVSEVLSLSKKKYTELGKVLYVVLMASRKLRHYFQAYHIIVPSSQPLKDIMRNK